MKQMKMALAAAAVAAVAVSAQAATITTTTSWTFPGTMAFQTPGISGESSGPTVKYQSGTSSTTDAGALFKANASGEVQQIAVRLLSTGHVLPAGTSMFIDFVPVTVPAGYATTISNGNGGLTPYTSPVNLTNAGFAFGSLSRATATVGATVLDPSGGGATTYLVFDVADQDWSVASGQWYSFLIGFTNQAPNTAQQIRLDANGAGAFNGAMEIRRDGSSFAFPHTAATNNILTQYAGSTTRDIVFAVSVPEPASLGLIGLAGLGLLHRRRA